MLGDPLVAMALAGRATSTIELGTAVLQTYPCHPLLQAHRAASVAAAMGRPGLHPRGGTVARVERSSGIYGLSYDHPGRNTEEYVRILTALLRGEGVEFEGEDWTVRAPEGRVATRAPGPRAALRPVAAAAPRRRRARRRDGALDGARERRSRPTSRRGSPQRRRRPVARRPGSWPASRVAVHDDVDAARQAVAATAPVLRRPSRTTSGSWRSGRADGAADAAIVGDEAAVEAQLRSLFDAGATDLSAFIVPVGPDRRASVCRTTELLSNLAREMKEIDP